jgi:hypothetical protein
MAEATDPFNDMDDSAAVMAYIHQKHGNAALAELLAVDDYSQESLIGDAELLTAMGLEECAAIVAEAAANAPPKCNPFPENTADWRDWNRRDKGSFEGFYLDDDERAERVKALLKPTKGK